MLRSVRNSADSDSAKIDIAPMIDCVFLLLIFFIVTSVFRDDPGIEVQRPDVSGAVVAERNALLVAITADDRLYFDGREIRLEQLVPLLRQASFSPETPLIIRADQATSHGQFAAVYSEAKRAGVGPVQFATERGGNP